MTDDPLPALTGPVEVVGAGLIGTSIALVCSRLGIEVVLRDASEENIRTAHGLGAGRAATDADRPQLVVVAVPPARIADAIVEALGRTDAVVTDVGSVKAAPLAAVTPRVGAADLARYVGSHPMAGSERSGPLAASAALFDGRPWAVTPHGSADSHAVGLVESLVLECGAAPVRMGPTEHDRAVARISHLPHLAAVLVAGRLATAPVEHLALSGQGVRDVTRVAASDPALWQQILEANSEAVLDLLAEVRADLDALMTAVAADSGPDLVEILARGNAGTAAIPGKHGGPARPTRSVFVAVPDHPGELARLFGDAGEIGVNIEDVHIDHDPGRPVGLTELVVERGSAERLLAALESRGWTTHR
ncbi:prephenate dehydrogenase [Nocardioides ganghwensis]|uniref:Prephenate dehydrogenase n=1 Tax=Nocardioides ganghwensis TaxID=252230 RepID=A0A4Q2S950_9ACTN|nr:prephenate dehydrogenase [Nocardioides ganghwensis]MBD3948047.1 prephenate dehydrogenase [Nocardioides ganghwensis]RYB97349.1 prephenate dehydrogenase [Nocardioides ganghwensis]